MPTEPTPPTMRIATESGIRFLIADNPGRLNAYTRDMWEALPALIQQAEVDPGVRVIVLGPEPRRFRPAPTSRSSRATGPVPRRVAMTR